MARVLIVDDEPPVREALSIGLAEVGHEIEAVGSAGEGLRLALEGSSSKPFDVVLLDLRLPDRHGLEVLTELRERGNATPVIVISADTEMSSTVRAMRDGAFDYVSKPIDLDELERVLGRAIALSTRAQHAATPSLPPPSSTPGTIELVGNSPALREVFKTLGLLSASRATVLIRGESGTGKELAARALHVFSQKKGEETPFVAVNCAALPGPLVEAEIFGHRRGAFTGADRERPGKLEAAGNGTLFLDEVGEVPLETQVKLLRVLQERTYERLGETEPRAFRARVVTATHRDLEALVREGKFREDLYFRLNVATVTLPPLRERREDVPILAERLVGAISREVGRSLTGLSPGALERLRQHSWPGNVRELRNVLTRAAVKCRGSTIDVEDLEIGTAEAHDARATAPDAPGRANGNGDDRPFPTLDEVERDHIRRALTRARGHKGKTCDLLGISRPTLSRKIKRYALGAPGSSPD